jgi:hypothetical protein
MGAEVQNARKLYCFVSYSSREPHVQILVECLRILFYRFYEVVLTPSGLESGASQRQQISDLIRDCAFAVVVLDGLRPNVVFEYGMLHAMGKPVILLKEEEAQVDIRSFFKGGPELAVSDVLIDMDSQFSNVKDLFYATWRRFRIQETVRSVWEEYRKKKEQIAGYADIPEPKLWE